MVKQKMQALPLRRFLIRLIWFSVMPLVVLALYLAASHVRTLQAQIDRDAGDRVRNAATAVDRYLGAEIAALKNLAASPLVDNQSRWREFYQEAQAYRENFGGHVILADLSMQMLINTRAPLGSALPRLPQPKGHAAVPAVLATGKPAVGDMFFGPVAKEPLVAVAVPVVREGRTHYLLLSTIATRKFQRGLDEVAVPPGWSLTLLDGKGDAMARSPAVEERRRPEESLRGRFSAKLNLSYWSVVLDVSPRVYRAPIVMSATALGIAILFFTLLSIVTGRIVGRRLARSVASLAEPSSPASPPYIAEVEEARRVLRSAAEAREAAESLRRESVAEQKRAEEALAEKERHYRLLTENIKDVVWILDTDTMHFRYVSPSVHGLRGYTAEEVMSVPAEMALMPDAREQTMAGIRMRAEAARTGRASPDTFYTKEVVQPCKDGSTVWTEVIAGYYVSEETGHVEVRGVTREITDRKQAEEALKTSLKEKEVLLKEIHHRVKNNLQVMSSLLNLQTQYLSDPKTRDIFRVSMDRIKSMALIHDKLYRSEDLSSISFPEYAGDLVRDLVNAYAVGRDITLNLNIDPVSFNIDTAIPLGLLINELVSNSLKHAFSGMEAGMITIDLSKEDGKVTLTVSDDGVGFPEGLDFTDTPSLGMQLVVTLVEQLEGAVELVKGKGTEFRISFGTE